MLIMIVLYLNSKVLYLNSKALLQELHKLNMILGQGEINQTRNTFAPYNHSEHQIYSQPILIITNMTNEP